MLSRRKRYHFEVIVKLHSLIAVPYVNAVTFAKLRLLDTRHSSQYSTRVEIQNHTVSWNTEHRFICKFRSMMGTNFLETKCLKISIRMETKGGKSFYKVGFVCVNLAAFAAMGNATCRRRYILEGYDEKHKRQDNSLLLVSFSMRQIFGDTCFRVPPENLSNCLVEPPDSDEGENIATLENDASVIDRKLNATLIGGLLGSDIIPNGRTTFEHRLRTLNLDPLVSVADTYSGQPMRSGSSVSPRFPHISHLVHQNASGLNLLVPGSETAHALFATSRIPKPSAPEELTTLLTELVPSNEAPLGDGSCRISTVQTFDSELGNQKTNQPPVNGDSVAPLKSSSDFGLTLTPGHNRRSASCPATHQNSLQSCLRSTVVATGDSCAHASVSPVDKGCTSSFHPTLESVVGRINSAEAVLVSNSSPSSSITPTSFSSTPGSTATASPVTHVSCKNNLNPKRALAIPSVDLISNPSTSVDPVLSGFSCALKFTDENSACHSLPLPPHHSAIRRRCDPFVPTPTSIVHDSLHHKPSEYFATDTGLLLPSRRRKSRPVADFAFPPSQMCVLRPNREAHDLSTSDRDLNDPGDAPEYGDTEVRDENVGLSLTKYRLSGLESRSSGYQSHSRQSSLESQAVTGSACPLVPIQRETISTNSYGGVLSVSQGPLSPCLETVDKNQTTPRSSNFTS